MLRYPPLTSLLECCRQDYKQILSHPPSSHIDGASESRLLQLCASKNTHTIINAATHVYPPVNSARPTVRGGGEQVRHPKTQINIYISTVDYKSLFFLLERGGVPLELSCTVPIPRHQQTIVMGRRTVDEADPSRISTTVRRIPARPYHSSSYKQQSLAEETIGSTILSDKSPPSSFNSLSNYQEEVNSHAAPSNASVEALPAAPFRADALDDGQSRRQSALR